MMEEEMKQLPRKPVLLFCAILVSATFAVIASLCIVCSPGTPVSNEPLSTVPLDKVVLSNTDVVPWKEDDSVPIRYYSPDTSFFNGVDGLAQLYVDLGVVKCADQHIVNADTACRILAMDFGTIAKAAVIFDTITHGNYITEKATFSSFSGSAAVLDTAPLLGDQAYAHFNRFFFQIYLSSPGDKSQAIAATEKILNALKRKVGP
jgi:hypothetical protein